MTTLLVCGGRNFDQLGWFSSTLNKLHKVHKFTLVIHGGATGADGLAGQWAQRHAIAEAVFPAPWEHHGARSGPMRNGWIMKHGNPDLIVAFPGGRGTQNMIDRARATTSFKGEIIIMDSPDA